MSKFLKIFFISIFLMVIAFWGNSANAQVFLTKSYCPTLPVISNSQYDLSACSTTPTDPVVGVSAPVYYAIKIENQGSAGGVDVTENLPAGFVLSTITCDDGNTYTTPNFTLAMGSGQTINCVIEGFFKSQQRSLPFSAIIVTASGPADNLTASSSDKTRVVDSALPQSTILDLVKSVDNNFTYVSVSTRS